MMRMNSRPLVILLVLALLFSMPGAARAQEVSPQTLPPPDETTTWELTRDGSSRQGTGSVSDLRASLYDSGIDWLEGPAELFLTLPIDGQSLNLQLDANITTGYRW
jgi:hypothetical protein